MCFGMRQLSKVTPVGQTALVRVDRTPTRRNLREVQRKARREIAELLEHSTAKNTKKAYAADWKHFADWCADLNVCPLPATVDTILAYLAESSTMTNSSRQGRGTRRAEKRGYAIATVTRRLTTVGRNHREAGHENPCVDPRVKKVFRGLRVKIGTATRKKAALLTEHFRALRREPQTLGEFRDRALLLIGFSGAFRRSELVALDVSDCELDEATRTLTIHLRRSKTDQEGKGRRVVIHQGGALCPQQALRQWLDGAGISEGPVFRSVRKGKTGRVGGRMTTEGLALVVKRYAAKLGLDPKDFGGHSLRAGHVTQAILRGEAAHAIMAVTGHQSRAMVDRYFRDVDPKRHNSSANLGL